MNAAIDQQLTEAEGAAPQPPRRHRRRKVIITAAIVIALGAGGIAGEHIYALDHRPAASGVQDNGAATATVPVSRRTLSSQQSMAGTLGYTGSYTILSQGSGTVTWLPSAGQVIQQGQELYRVNGSPVILLYGSTPAYRPLAEGNSGSTLTGADVRQLNRDLVALGYASRDDLSPSSNEFTWATKAAIKKLQQHLGLQQSGALTLGQVVFLPTAARVTDVSATLGGPASGPVFKATSTTPQVSVNLDASLQSQVKVGDRVSITLPNGQAAPGVVTSVGTVATSGSGSGSSGAATVPVAISPLKMPSTGHLDQASVQVAITVATVHDALVVPVNALLALASGGFAVEVVDTRGKHELVPVTAGLFDDSDGLVQVTSTGLTPGQRVVVPSS